MVEINCIGLIKSAKTLGETTVTAVVTNGKSNDIASQDTAVVRVVSLSGIHLILSSTNVEEGDIICAHIEGLDQDETPFSFGGAQYPFTVVWKISAAEVLAFHSLLTVMHVKSLHLSMEMPVISSLASATIPTLPQGCKIQIRVQFRDSRGRLFNSANNDLKYRPHRFDLTDIVTLENNRTFDIVLKEAGETVFLFIHRNTDNAVMVSPGDASVYVKLSPEGKNATTFSSIKIRQPSFLQFINSPKYVSNIKRRVFAFPVQFGKTLNDTPQNIYGCDATDLTVFSGVLLPFDCVSSIGGSAAPISAVNFFTTRAVFDPTIGSC
uniref:Uncharacterized protein n=1 Tax=Panagrolaimus davidi TaxID=227884 RepID=A0A914PL52_9BILA